MWSWSPMQRQVGTVRVIYVALVFILIANLSLTAIPELRVKRPWARPKASQDNWSQPGNSWSESDSNWSRPATSSTTPPPTAKPVEIERFPKPDDEAPEEVPGQYIDWDSEPPPQQGTDIVKGLYAHVRPTRPGSGAAAVPGCKYPVVLHLTPDGHCSGAMATYGSIIRNVLLQPKALQGKVCVHFTYTDKKLKHFEKMYQWPAMSNPFRLVKHCDKLSSGEDAIKAFDEIVPVRWHALAPSDAPANMRPGYDTWREALNKVQSWAFDLYPRSLFMDTDSFLVYDLHRIFDEVAPHYVVAGAPDSVDCAARGQINGGMLLLKPSRYFHIAAVNVLHDPDGSCLSGIWHWSEQELINCMCGYNIAGREQRAMRPEFACTIMPVYNSMWAHRDDCDDSHVYLPRSIHYAGTRKPWDMEDDHLDKWVDTRYYKCLRDTMVKEDVMGLKLCQFTMQGWWDKRPPLPKPEDKKPEDKKPEEKAN